MFLIIKAAFSDLHLLINKKTQIFLVFIAVVSLIFKNIFYEKNIIGIFFKCFDVLMLKFVKNIFLIKIIFKHFFSRFLSQYAKRAFNTAVKLSIYLRFKINFLFKINVLVFLN